MRNVLTGVFVALLAGGCGGGGSVEPLPVNAPPSLSLLADVTQQGSGTSTVTVQVADDRTDAAALQLEASSDNEALLPAASIVIEAAGASRTVTLTPVADVLGSAVVRLRLVDADGLQVQRAFTLTVVPRPTGVADFVRATFAVSRDDQPALINTLSFDNDATDDDFADLLAP